MKKPKIALRVWSVLLALALGYEAYALLFLKGETLSEGVWYGLEKAPIAIAAVSFFVLGHWFWQRRK